MCVCVCVCVCGEGEEREVIEQLCVCNARNHKMCVRCVLILKRGIVHQSLGT